MTAVLALWPGAPVIGSTDRIHCGVARTPKRRHYTIVGGVDDVYRACRIVGYRIDVDARGVELLVVVKMNQRHPLIQREFAAHVNCLESWQLEKT